MALTLEEPDNRAWSSCHAWAVMASITQWYLHSSAINMTGLESEGSSLKSWINHFPGM